VTSIKNTVTDKDFLPQIVKNRNTFTEDIRTRRSAIANRSHVSIHGRPCKNLPHITVGPTLRDEGVVTSLETRYSPTHFTIPDFLAVGQTVWA